MHTSLPQHQEHARHKACVALRMFTTVVPQILLEEAPTPASTRWDESVGKSALAPDVRLPRSGNWARHHRLIKT